MARDVHDFKIPIKRDQYVNGALQNASTTNQQLTRSFRSDSVPTDPFPNGGYHAVTGYSAFFSRISYASGEVGWNTSFGNKYLYRWDGPEVPSAVWRAGCNSLLRPDVPGEVIARVRSSIDSQIRDDLDLAQFAGEARETARLLAETLRKLLSIVRAVRKLGRNPDSWRGWAGASVTSARKAAKPGSASRSAAQAYLKYMYGVRPLISDVRKIASHWDERCEAPVSKQLFATHTVDTNVPTTRWRSASGPKMVVGCSSGAYAFVTNPQLLRASQYGLTSPLTLAWELTTLSFVVDWFTGIGAFLRGLEPPLGVAIRDYWETQFADCNFVWAIDYYGEKGSPGTLYTPRTLSQANVRVKAMARTTPARLLPPPPYINLGVSSSQAVSLLALIRSGVRD